MIVASYRNTERGISAARHNSVVLPFIAPVKPQLFETDYSLVPLAARRFERFMDAVSAELAARHLINEQSRYRANFERIVQRLSRVFQVSMVDLHSARCDRKASHSRQAIYYWAWRLTRLSSPQIGRRLGNRDHTTVLHGISAYQRKRAQMGRHLRALRKGG
ncbi:helix-turn-helix domain-containing protein [Pseudochrobactrum sp. MP213Fo]|uniref:helix-turn-helix domain-containing protein n=1 Tax=Pseudochrobactrum sp. MP213Fo TaxID=3022250 RepID=UPI003B9EA34D